MKFYPLREPFSRDGDSPCHTALPPCPSAEQPFQIIGGGGGRFAIERRSPPIGGSLPRHLSVSGRPTGCLPPRRNSRFSDPLPVRITPPINTPPECRIDFQRRERDSNPRYHCWYTVFPGLRTRPLCDPSKPDLHSSYSKNSNFYPLTLTP